jgi:hypothetical protein
MGRLSRWWQRVSAGRDSRTSAPSPVRRSTTPVPTENEAGLAIAADPKKAVRRTARTGAAGFDPYSSDSGYAKPHSWERIDHD